jgi:hypothetical protein
MELQPIPPANCITVQEDDIRGQERQNYTYKTPNSNSQFAAHESTFSVCNSIPVFVYERVNKHSSFVVG